MRLSRSSSATHRATAITLTCCALAVGCASAPSGASADGARAPDAAAAEAPDSASPDGFDAASAGADAHPGPGVDDPSDGPAAALLIDGTVHTGTDWSGAPYVGVWGEPMNFHMSDYPLSWAIGAVHASMLLRSRGIDYSPNAVLSVAIKESRLGCAGADFPNGDGCFQIESTTAYEEMRRMFPGRFDAEHAEAIGGDHFASSAITLAYYTVFTMAMFRLHTDDPVGFFADHPDPLAQQKVICAAYNRGLWWQALSTVFSQCGDSDVTECFEDNAIAIDHANAIADYTLGLDDAEPFDAALTFADLEQYWGRIRALYPEADDAEVRTRLLEAFDAARGPEATLSFHRGIRPVIHALIETLAPVATVDQATQAACDYGYLYGDACQAPPTEF